MAAPGNGGDVAQRLLSMKKKLEEKKDRRSELQGELKSIQKQLVEEFKAKSLEDAEAMIEAGEEEQERLEQEIWKEIEEIEKMMMKGEGREHDD